MKRESPLKSGWHWKKSEVALLKDYIRRRFDGGVGWGSGRSEIEEIANRLGRDYFAVYRKMQRIVDEMQVEALPRPKRGRRKAFAASISLKVTEQFRELITDRALELGMNDAEYIRSLIRADVDATKCSGGKRRVNGVGSMHA